MGWATQVFSNVQLGTTPPSAASPKFSSCLSPPHRHVHWYACSRHILRMYILCAKKCLLIHSCGGFGSCRGDSLCFHRGFINRSKERGRHRLLSDWNATAWRHCVTSRQTTGAKAMLVTMLKIKILMTTTHSHQCLNCQYRKGAE